MSQPTFFTRSTAALLKVAAWLVLAAPASAQVTLTGRAEFGARQLFGERASAKFLEYRSIPQGLFVSHVDVALDGGESGYFLRVNADDALEGDQSVRLQAGRLGRYELAAEYGRVPHLFTNTGTSLLYAPDAPGVYTLPDQIQVDLNRLYSTDIDPAQPGVQRDLAALAALINGMVRPVDVSLSRESGRIAFRYTPSPEWDLRVSYFLENQRGARPIGATFSFNTQEQLEPIDYATHEVRVDAERSGNGWAVGAGYVGGFFRNRVDALVWDNPFLASDLATSGSKGRLDLYPDNERHQGTLTAGFAVPLRGRWTTSVSLGVMSQDDSFLPFTTNAAIPDVPALPAPSANAEIRTTHVNSVIALAPAARLGLNVRYRYYDRNNRTPVLGFPDYVRTDDRLAAAARTNRPYAHTQKTAGIDATWRLLDAVSLKGGFERDDWDRAYRETTRTSERTWTGMVNVTHGGWLFLRGSVRTSDRHGDAYDPERVADQGFPQGEIGGQLESLRKFDQADRSRNRRELIARFTPGGAFSLSASHSWLDDEYEGSEYGLQESAGHTTAFDVGFTPTAGWTLSVDYARGLNRMKMRSRQRTATNDKPDNDWVSSVKEPLNSYGAGFMGQLVPAKLELDLRYHRSEGRSMTRTSTPGTPDLVTTAADYPEVVNDRQVVDLALQYHASDRTTLHLKYGLEQYDQVDFAMDPMAAFMGFVEPGSAGTTWIGVTRPDYRAHLLALSLVVQF